MKPDQQRGKIQEDQVAWQNEVEQVMREQGKEMEEARELELDRKEWRKFWGRDTRWNSTPSAS